MKKGDQRKILGRNWIHIEFLAGEQLRGYGANLRVVKKGMGIGLLIHIPWNVECAVEEMDKLIEIDKKISSDEEAD